jgi:hypothetical protein
MAKCSWGSCTCNYKHNFRACHHGPAPVVLSTCLRSVSGVLTERHSLPLAMAGQPAELALSYVSDQGRCVMRGSCGVKAPRYDAALPCPDDGEPQEVRLLHVFPRNVSLLGLIRSRVGKHETS